MQEYTSLETSKQLYEMFGWSGTGCCYYSNSNVPTYTLTYLLDKLQLPYQIESHKHQHNRKELGYDNYHIVCWPDTPGIDFINSDGSELVEAAALLCLELGKQGILPRKDK